jgi:hypothetical protein
MNARFANTRAQCGAFLDTINEIIPLELPEDKSETTPASEDPGRELSSKRSLAVDLINNGANVLDHLFVLCFTR